MKTKQLLFSMAAAVAMVACTNEDFTNAGDFANSKMMDASNFSLVSNGEGVATRLVTTPGFDMGENEWVFPADAWEVNDAIGFTHIYTDQKIVTNYNFKIADKKDIDKEGNAIFRTDNSTIFEGDYFVYYPFNENYADYEGVPVALDAIQAQDASVAIKASDVLAEGNKDNFVKAGKHLNRFAISNRIAAKAQVNQQKFTLNPFMGNLYLKLYPVNQTKDIFVKRVEITCDGQFATAGRFNALAGVAEPQFKASANSKKIVLTFNKLNTDANQNGLKLVNDTKAKDALMGYVSLMPGTYKNITFKVFYTETENLKCVSVEKKVNLEVKSNSNTRVSLPIDANGATEVTSYDIYSESEFAAAVKKSNAMNEGTDSKAVFTLMDDITLTSPYELKGNVPVSFLGGKSITLSGSKAKLTITSKKPVVIDATIKGGKGTKDQNIIVNNEKAEVEIAAIDSKSLYLSCKAGKATVLNANKQGSVGTLDNNATLTVNNSVVEKNVVAATEASAKPVINLSNVFVKGDFAAEKKAATVASSIENVTVLGNFTSSAVINVKGTNVLSYSVDEDGNDVFKAVTNTGTLNVVSGTTTVATLTSGIMNIDGEVIAKDNATLSGLVTIKDNGKFVAEKNLTGVKQANLDIEGVLETNGEVAIEGGLKYCGIINNYGEWTLDNNALSQRNHSHSTKVAKFNNAGVVTVKGIEEIKSEAIKLMPKSLYNQVENGRLVWSGMKNVSKIAEFAKLSADDCWATDFEAVVTAAGTESLTMTDTKTATYDWSKKNIIITVEGQGAYELTIAKGKPLSVKNLTLNFAAALTTKYTADAKNKKPFGILVAETMTVNNVYTQQDNPEYTTCPTKTTNLIVDGGKNTGSKLVIKNAADNLKYTGKYTQLNDKQINYTEGSPKLYVEK